MQKLSRYDVVELLSEWLEPRDSLKCKLVIPKVYNCIASNLNFKSIVEYHPNMNTCSEERFSNIFIRFVSDELLDYIQSGKVRKLKLMENLKYRIRDLIDAIRDDIDVDYNFINIAKFEIYLSKTRYRLNSINTKCTTFYRHKELRETLVKIKIGRSILLTIDFGLFPNLEEVVVIKEDSIPYKISLDLFPITLKSITIPYTLFHDTFDESEQKIYENLTVIKSTFFLDSIHLFPNLKVIHTMYTKNIIFFFEEVEKHCRHIEEIVILDRSPSTLSTGCIQASLLRKLKVFSLYLEDDMSRLDYILSNCIKMQDLIFCGGYFPVIMRKIKDMGLNIRLLDTDFVELNLVKNNRVYLFAGNSLTYSSTTYELDLSLVKNVTRVYITHCIVENIERFIKAFKNLKICTIKINKSGLKELLDAIEKYNPNFTIEASNFGIGSQTIRVTSSHVSSTFV